MTYQSDLSSFLGYKPAIAINSRLDKLILLFKVSRLLEDIINNRALTGQASEDTLQIILDQLNLLKSSLELNSLQIVNTLIEVRDKLISLKDIANEVDTTIDELSAEATDFFADWKTGLATNATQIETNESLSDLAIDIETSTALSNQVKISVGTLQSNSTESLHDLESDIEGLMITIDGIIDSINLSNLIAAMGLLNTSISEANSTLEELGGVSSSIQNSVGENIATTITNKLDQMITVLNSFNSEDGVGIYYGISLSTGGLNEVVLEHLRDANENTRRIAYDDYSSVYAKYEEINNSLDSLISMVSLLGAIKDNLEVTIS